jgi:cytochrome d ubiquinol oxidase subunit I
MCVFEMVQGHLSAEIVAKTQPAKLAAMESHWETQGSAPMNLIAWPDQKNERNLVEAWPVPGVLSFLAHYDFTTPVTGLKDIPKEDRPHVIPVFFSFRAMIALGVLFFLVALWAVWKSRRIGEQALLLKILPWMIPVPYVANLLGWTVAEMGRQPWIVYGLMRTEHGVSKIAASQVWGSMAMFFIIYSLLGAIDFYLIWTFARKGPLPETHTASKA